MPRLFFAVISLLVLAFSSIAQPGRWQQRVKYNMDIRMDVQTNRFTGTQKLEYTNNSPDTLDQLFYHLYWNAFQPNSMMDARSRELGNLRIGNRPDWDGRVRDRILNLKEDEIGYQRVRSLKMNGQLLAVEEHETILQVKLPRPILPKQKVLLEMEFEAQVPLQVRRSGRDAANGVRFSMAQWYPKLCEYDADGWHPNPYVAREFYGVWGDFDVSITIDKNYTIGGTGYLLNANQVGHGYETPGTPLALPAGDQLTWKFTAPNVHDFVWAADPGYKHLVRQLRNGPTIHVLYKNKPGNIRNDQEWQRVADAAETVYPFIARQFGAYPYKQYSFIQGGDGGMEYPMATLLNGPGLGTVFHEWMHSWYQMLMGTNESLYAWMDEGFTEFATDRVQHYYDSVMAAKNGTKMRPTELPLYHSDNYRGYFGLVKSGREEPLTTHADHFSSNYAYSVASYSKGAVFLSQLGYITGEAARDRILLEYYRQWRFRHPNVNDFMRLAEKESGLQLDWYKEYWVNGTKTIDYAIDSLWEEGGKSKIRIRRVGEIPMPIDLVLTFRDGSTQLHYIPMYLLFGSKPAEDNQPRVVYPAWKWTHPTYTIEFDRRLLDLTAAEIDPTQRMADTDRRNNRLELKW
ncbi:MAG TPA: M1 family metallopeptidase [Lacibacter sp.]|nr:M1 family metallopeptidase [Lacibacter sp.]HMO87711.1 M1 family metallopeptidase [Lacibacter sp.]HMP86239.1 M1 family metallopeptidase [Lacibacter sp.]